MPFLISHLVARAAAVIILINSDKRPIVNTEWFQLVAPSRCLEIVRTQINIYVSFKQ